MKGLVFFAVGLICAVAFNMFKRVPNQSTTIGQVVSSKWAGTGTNGGGNLYVYTVEYEVDGKFYQFKDNRRQGPGMLGKKVKVAYNAKKVTEAFVMPSIGEYIIVGCFFALGVVAVYSIVILGDETVFGIFG